ncbi:protein-L-isoaspartate(D-aspartate) O-methyltransferase [Pararobbsia silviterrae]|uniref:Protein-L-isoaspartate O-methyltransferase n=2 Tax=Pararobbsia silviterrae TaxID=1792498 RepID=A0A494XZU7_9BURK|nr:protein-L-isoaspartate(D-aspartate) O-methyltransferase [Pararobbsia silviterrae]
MPDFEAARRAMVDGQLRGRGMLTDRVLDAMRRVPRHAFVPGELDVYAYADSPLPIGEHQTISQPFVVALMTQAAAPSQSARVLEIGTGSGYGAAVLAELASHVDTIERIDTLALHARRVLAELGYTQIDVHIGDGTLGLPDHAPFDAIVVTASGPTVPDVLARQLAIGGRLVIPVGLDPDYQRLVRVTRRSDAVFDRDDLGGVQFVPLIGAHGWSC